MQDINMTLNNCVQQSNHIWGVPAGILGEAWHARTNVGNQVTVWVPHHTNQLRHSYFCHGWALGTYQLHGYTVFSGPSMARVLQDEWNQIMMPAVGDICVWFGNAGGMMGTPLHSARVEAVGGFGDGMLLTSKNGAAALGGLATFAAVNAVYTAAPHNCNARRFYRRIAGLPGALPLLPQ